MSRSHCPFCCCKSVSLALSYPWRLLVVESSFIFSTITIAAVADDPLSDVIEDSSGGGGATDVGCEPVPAEAAPVPAVVLLAVAAAVVDCCSRNWRRRFLIHSSWQSWFRGRSGGGILDGICD